ncbi:MAG: hypothetical protein Q9187_002722 [Circinaria calcarea]
MKLSAIIFCAILTLTSASALPGGSPAGSRSKSPSPVRVNYESKDGVDTARNQAQHGVQLGHLTKDKAVTNENRKETTGGLPTHPGKTNDEKPHASLKEGGKGAHVESVGSKGQHELLLTKLPALVEGGKMAAAKEKADKKGTDKVAFFWDDKPAGKDNKRKSPSPSDDDKSGPASRTRLQTNKKQKAGRSILLKREAVAAAYANAYADAYADAYAENLHEARSGLHKRGAMPVPSYSRYY